MRMPTLRLAHLRTWPECANVGQSLRRDLDGKVVALPVELGTAELAVTIDALALLADLPVRTIASVDYLAETALEISGRPTLLVVARPCQQPPDGLTDAVVVCTVKRAAGSSTLELPPELLRIRDALIDCLGQHSNHAYSQPLAGVPGARLRTCASWLYRVSDSPATALAAMENAVAALIIDPDRPEEQLHAIILAGAIARLLSGVVSRVAEWAVAWTLADTPSSAHRLVSSAAASLGPRVAWQRALDAGLVTHVSEEPGDGGSERDPLIDLRRPLTELAALSAPPAEPGRPTLKQVAGALGTGLRPLMTNRVYAVFNRALRPLEIPAPLRGPRPPEHVIGRDDVLTRLLALLAPGVDITVCVLYGMAGIGKTAVAARLGQLVGGRQQFLWLDLGRNPLAAFARLAQALGVSARPPALFDEDHDEGDLPDWLHSLHERLRDEMFLLVLDDVDGLDPEELAELVPAGPGRCAVLILARSSLPVVQRRCNALTVQLSGLDDRDARALLAYDGDDAETLIDLLDGHPLALQLGAALLASGERDAGELLQRLSLDQETRGLAALLVDMLARLSPDERQLVQALSVCASYWVPLTLVRPLTPDINLEAALDGLVARCLVERDVDHVHLHGVIRLMVVQDGAQPESDWWQMAQRHTIAVEQRFREAYDRSDRTTMDQLYPEDVDTTSNID